jgi:hypothetical protein
MVSFVNLREHLFHIVKITCAGRHFISVYSLKEDTWNTLGPNLQSKKCNEVGIILGVLVDRRSPA